MDRVNSAIPNGSDEDGNESDDGNSNGDDDDGNGDDDDGNGDDESDAESPELQVETEYNSREEYRQPGEQLNDFEDTDDWELLDGEAEVDDETYFDGSQSLKLTAEDGDNIVIATELDDTMDMSDLDISMAVQTSTPGNLAIDIQLRDIYGGYAHHQLPAVTYRTPDIGWFRTCPGVYDESSTPLERDVIDEVRIIIHNTEDAEVWVDDLRTHEKPDSGYVILCWDDGFSGFYEEASPLHDEYDVNAVQAVVRQWTRDQRDGVMTINEILERQEAGDQIVAHGTHQALAEEDEDYIRENLETDKNWAVQQELEGGHYIVFPHNSFDQQVLDIASDYYYAGGFNQSGDVNLTGVTGFDPLVLPRTIGSDLDIAMRSVTQAAEHRQCTVLNFHDFGLDNSIDKDEYEELLQHINDTDGVEVIDIDDLWNMRRAGH
jgi:peptidoglycan/xylan/chitin deacetylase (PgdA/CDA1 family)